MRDHEKEHDEDDPSEAQRDVMEARSGHWSSAGNYVSEITLILPNFLIPLQNYDLYRQSKTSVEVLQEREVSMTTGTLMENIFVRHLDRCANICNI